MLGKNKRLPCERNASRIRAQRAIGVWLVSLLMAACVRHLPVVGDEDQAPSTRAGGGGRGATAGIGAQRAARSESAQRAAGGSSDEEDAESSSPAKPVAGVGGSKPASSTASAQRAGSNAPNAAKAGAAAAADSANATAGTAAPSTPSTPSNPSTPSGMGASGGGWYCGQASNACSCVEVPASAGDTCTKPHPTCCFEVSNGTANRTCLCVPEGSQECMAYSMTQLQDFKKISSCPP
jgi:hypothetical protein